MRYTLLSAGQPIGYVTLDAAQGDSSAPCDRLGRLEPLPAFEPIRAALAVARASMIAALRSTFELSGGEDVQSAARAGAAPTGSGFDFTTDLKALAARLSPRDRKRMDVILEWSRTKQRLALALEDESGLPVTAWVSLIESGEGDDRQLPTPAGPTRPEPVILVGVLFGAESPDWQEFPRFE